MRRTPQRPAGGHEWPSESFSLSVAAVPIRRYRRVKESPMKARVTVTLKSGILDPQGKAIEGALASLGIAGVASVRQGKVFDIEISGSDKAKAEAALKDAADKLLANTVIENYRVEVLS
jgi:phosphoribosylformylglycinamidine synthase subunit PurS